jgi:predicted RNA-binding protein with PUA-like domain
MHYFLLKTEPTEYSIDDFARDGVTPWFGVRNYQARNTIRDEIKRFLFHNNMNNCVYENASSYVILRIVTSL